MTEPHDDLDGLLSPRPAAGPSDQFREALRERTGWELVGRLRTRRTVQLVVGVVGVIGVFALGMLNGLNQARPEPVIPLGPALRPEVVVVSVPVVVPLPESPPVPSPERFVSASQLEVRAELAD